MRQLNKAEFIEQFPIPLFIVNQEEKLINYNRQFLKLFNVELQKGKNITDFFKIEQMDDGRNIYFISQQDHTVIFLKRRFPTSEEYVYIGIEEVQVEEVKEYEQLKTLERDFDTIIESSYDGIYITDANGVTLKVNSAIEEMAGIPKEYYIGKNVNDLVERGILDGSVTMKVLEREKVVSLVQRNYKGKDILFTGTPIFNDQKEIVRVLINVRDLSKLNDLEIELRKAKELNEEYRREILNLQREGTMHKGIVIKSDVMEKLYESADRIANVDATILILGETGVGKDVFAKYIYDKSERSKDGKFIKLNCGAIPAELLESELFGYEPGAFTGANPKGKTGLFEAAHNGILFLDEIGELPLDLQVKLLRVLQEGEIQKIGGVKQKKVNVRIIAATNKDLKQMVADGQFREDLYYRLNVVPFHIPPLRERREDIIPIAQHVIKKVNEKYNMNKRFSHELRGFFHTYNWPGNIRELSNLVERLIVTTPRDEVTPNDLPEEYTKNLKEEQSFQINAIIPLKKAIEQTEKKLLQLAANEYETTYEIAEALETSQPTIVRRLQKYGINNLSS